MNYENTREFARRVPYARTRSSGFTLIELMIVVAMITILTVIALPSYQRHIVRASRQAAQEQLMELATLQEKIYLNSSAYSNSVSAAYTGTSTGGLGLTSGKTADGKYSLAAENVTTNTFRLRATAVAGKSQVGDGDLTIDQSGQRLWGTQSW